jgi:hypothetical protein
VGRWSGIPQLAFLVLLGLTVWSLVWLHIAVMRLRDASFLLDSEGHLPPQYTTTSPL